MPQIAILSQQLVNKIAAGEVVERPASVVKELLENSIDAGSTRIDIEIEDGGKKLISVRDNGCGIDSEQVILAFTAHATSKISAEDDLFAINTMGFRGEALASIASVSQAEILTRTADTLEATRLQIAGGQLEPPCPAAAPVGTHITIRNLFFNTPARRKFLRTANTEMGHITDQLTRIALANTKVHLTLTHNNRKLYDLPAEQSLRERIGNLFSPDLAEELIPIKRSDRDVQITGLIAPPQRARANAQWQHVFMNSRHIRDRFISHAVREAYRGLLEINRQPVVFLFLTVDPQKVDVNVHPAKTEVRFADSNFIHSLVLATLRDQLLSTDLSVSFKTSPVQTTPSATDPDSSETPEQRKQRVRQAMADFFQATPPPPPANSPVTAPATYTTSAPTNRFASTDFTNQPFTSPPDRFATEPPAAPEPPTETQPTTPTDSSTESAPPAHSPSSPSPAAQRFLQIHNTYLVTQSEQGLVIIDQHALHERVIYEQLYQQLAQGRLASQRRLIPETLDVTDTQLAALDNAADLLKELGILIDQFGPRTVAIQGFPLLLGKLSPTAFINDLIDILQTNSGKLSREQLLHQILDMMACKAAVKAGDPLTEDEIESLLKTKQQTNRAGNCPHGRPTTISLSLDQLEKQFKRT
ncbi:MAG: DNA mismatch repair endonuclease MutL [Sedimentisphaerales bacterium]|nr:DNA mismatch repair endonuclease MutL [Sedimentisphaerales bacterium]